VGLLKRWVENISDIAGYDGEINPVTLKIAEEVGLENKHPTLQQVEAAKYKLNI